MTYSELPETVQLIYMANFEFFAKILLVSILIAWSFYYLYYQRYEKKLKYILSDKIEIIKFVFAKVILFTIPLWIFVLFPTVEIEAVINFLLVIYALAIPLAVIVLFIGTIYYGPIWLLRFTGYDFSRKDDQDIMRQLDKFVPKAKGFFPQKVNKEKK